jgi:hypothetical protein
MISSTDAEWDGWTAIDRAQQSGDVQRIVAAFRALRFDFHGQRHQVPNRWEAVFELLLVLFEHPDPGVAGSAGHYLFVVMGAQGGPPYDGDRWSEMTARAGLVHRRTTALLPVLRRQVQAGRRHVLDLADRLVHVESLADAEAHPGVAAWLLDVAAADEAAEAAHLAYVMSRLPWPEGRASLFAALDHPSPLVRGVAAREIGGHYLADALDPTAPPFAEVVAQITERELARPGVAGPLLSPWYTCDLEAFASQGGVNVEDWIATILTKRSAPEPDLLPCCNGIDFFAHELFGDRPERIRELLLNDADAIAVDAATELEARVEAMEPILMDLGAVPTMRPAAARRGTLDTTTVSFIRRARPGGSSRAIRRRMEVSSSSTSWGRASTRGFRTPRPFTRP